MTVEQRDSALSMSSGLLVSPLVTRMLPIPPNGGTKTMLGEPLMKVRRLLQYQSSPAAAPAWPAPLASSFSALSPAVLSSTRSSSIQSSPSRSVFEVNTATCLLRRLHLPKSRTPSIPRMPSTISLSSFSTALRLLPLPVVISSHSKGRTALMAPSS